MDPDEMDYESSAAGYEHDHNLDDDEDDELVDSDYILGLTATTDGGGDAGVTATAGNRGEEEGLSEDDDVGHVRFRLVRHEDEEDDDEDDGVTPIRHFLPISRDMPFRVEILGLSRRRRDPRRKLTKGLEPVPSREGQKLMRDGRFGTGEYKSYSGRRNPNKRPLPQHIRLLEREIGAYRGEKARIGNQLLAQRLVPSTKADFIMHYDAKCYSGQFSQDGNFFYSCSQDFCVRMYDTSNPYKWHHYKTVTYPGGGWTITDATLSPDNKMLAYSTIASTVYATNTTSELEETVALDFSATPRHNRNAMHRSFGIWSIRFSGDGKEIIAGTNDRNLYVYDIEAQTPILRLSGHQDDVNAVCFADANSPHILFSGSDDTTLKVWDRRSMASGKEAGVFCGHLEGLTYIDTKGDGRYVLSNSKDQTMKLWDIRKMMDPDAFNALKRFNYSSGYDYRSGRYNYPPARHPKDCSLVTYRGHTVLRTLIRCHFSPPTSSGSRYIYSGSSDGAVFIYNLDATTASVIDVYKETYQTRPYRADPGYGWSYGNEWRTCVRDASWHPNAGIIAAASWNGYGAENGTVSLHSWGGFTGEDEVGEQGPVRLNCWAKRDQSLYDDGELDEGTDFEERLERDRARVLRRSHF